MLIRKVLLCYILLGLVTAICLEGHASAQVLNPDWSAPYRLSSREGEASEGYMVSDQYGYVHIFWIESGFPDNRSQIMYVRFDGQSWTPANDVYNTKPGIPLGTLSPFVDAAGTIHLLWTEGNSGPVYYSRASAHEAQSANAWQEPILIPAPAYRIRFLVDQKRTFHLLYSEFYVDRPGLYYMRSEDEGQTWSTPTWLDSDIPARYAPYNLQFILDAKNNLHIVWDYIDLNIESVPSKWIRYTHSFDQGNSWSEAFTIDIADENEEEVRLAFPRLVSYQDDLCVVWAGTAKTNREYRLSPDRGMTWSEPMRIFGDLHGISLGDGLTVDSIGRVHFIGSMRYPAGLWHAVLEGGNWVGLSLFYLMGQDAFSSVPGAIGAHNIHLESRFNQLVLLFTNEPREPQSILFAMTRALPDVPPITPKPTPTPTKSAAWPDLVSTAKPADPTAQPPHGIEINNAQTAPISEAQRPLLWAIAPALVLIIGVLGFRILRK